MERDLWSFARAGVWFLIPDDCPAAAFEQPRIDVSGGPTVLLDDRLGAEVYAVPNVVRYDPNAPADARLSGAAFPYSPWTWAATA